MKCASIERLKQAYPDGIPPDVVERDEPLIAEEITLLAMCVGARAVYRHNTLADVARHSGARLFQIKLLDAGQDPGTRAAKKLLTWCDLSRAELANSALLLRLMNQRGEQLDVQKSPDLFSTTLGALCPWKGRDAA